MSLDEKILGDAAASVLQQGNTGAVQAAVEFAHARNPDEYAKQLEVAQREGIHPDLVPEFSDDIARRVLGKDFTDLSTTAQKTFAWGSKDPSNTTLIQDALPLSARIEKTLNKDNWRNQSIDVSGVQQRPGRVTMADVSNVAEGALLGASTILPRIAAGVKGIERFVNDASAASQGLAGLDLANPQQTLQRFIDQKLAEDQKDMTAFADEMSRIAGEKMQTGGLSPGVVSGLASAAQVGALVATPYLVLPLMGATTFGTSYGEGKDANLSMAKRVVYASVQSGIEVGTEYFAMGKFLRALSEGNPLLKASLEMAIKDVVGEQVATFFQDLNSDVMLRPEKPMSEFWAERHNAALQTLVATIVGAGGATTVAATADAVNSATRDYAAKRLLTDKNASSRSADKAKASQAEVNFDRLKSVFADAATHPLRERSPAKWKEYVDAVSEDSDLSEVYVNAKTLSEVFAQHGVNMQEVQAKMPEVAAQMIENAPIGDVRITMADLTTHITDAAMQDALLPHLKDKPGDEGYTYAQSQSFFQTEVASMEEQAQNIIAETTPVLSKEEFEAQKAPPTPTQPKENQNEIELPNEEVAAQATQEGQDAVAEDAAKTPAPAQTYEQYLSEHKNKQEVRAREVKTLRAEIQSEMSAMQTFAPSVVSAYATPLAEMYIVHSAKTGQSIAELRKQIPLKFVTSKLLAGYSKSPIDLKEGEPLANLPSEVEIDGVLHRVGPFEPARQAARDYMKQAGIPYIPQVIYVQVDPARAKKIADAFEAMPHDPTNPQVKEAYDALVKETLAQWQVVKATGLKVEFISGKDPYGNPRNSTEDVVNNNHLWVFPTSEGFGQGEDTTGNPLLEIVEGETISGQPVTVNDIFRIVHDYFGHVKEGVGFRANGEENAWRSHSSMFSPLAQRALTTETRGQNSWLNFGPQGEKNRTAVTEETAFAPQKTGLLPEWVSEVETVDPALLAQSATTHAKGELGQTSFALNAVHYGRARHDVLEGSKYGTGTKGAEARRLAESEDPRIKQRIHFYVDEGNGTQPEGNVGNTRHDVLLENMYDGARDPLKLHKGDSNAFESAVLDAGFNGYYVEGAFNSQGAAVLLGDAAKSVEAEKAYAQTESDALYTKALDTVRRAGYASSSLIQRNLHVPHIRAVAMLKRMQEEAYVGEPNKQGKHEVTEKINDVLYQSNAPTFYSPLARAVEGMQMGKGSPEQWIGVLNNLTQKGVKPAELRATGVLDWLEMLKTAPDTYNTLNAEGAVVSSSTRAAKPEDLPEGYRQEVVNHSKSVAKDDVLAHLSDNAVIVAPVIRGGPRQEGDQASGTGTGEPFDFSFGEWTTDDPDSDYLYENARERVGALNQDEVNDLLNVDKTDEEEVAEATALFEYLDNFPGYNTVRDVPAELSSVMEKLMDKLIEREERWYWEDSGSPQSRTIEVEANGTTYRFYDTSSYGEQYIRDEGGRGVADVEGDDPHLMQAIREHLEGIYSEYEASGDEDNGDGSEVEGVRQYLRPKWEGYVIPGGEDYQERLSINQTHKGEAFRHAMHFDEDNILGFTRPDSRRVPLAQIEASHPELAARLRAAGETHAKVYFLQEVQSDWAQKGGDKPDRQVPYTREELSIDEVESAGDTEYLGLLKVEHMQNPRGADYGSAWFVNATSEDSPLIVGNRSGYRDAEGAEGARLALAKADLWFINAQNGVTYARRKGAFPTSEEAVADVLRGQRKTIKGTMSKFDIYTRRAELNVELDKAYSAVAAARQALPKDEQVGDVPNTPGGAAFEEAKKRKNELQAEFDSLDGDAIPPSEFVGSTDAWVSLLLKDAIRDAVDKGHHLVSWTTGEQQVERWSGGLRAQVDKIAWRKSEDGKIHIIASQGDREKANTKYTENDLAAAIGKTMGNQIIADPNQSGEITGDGITVADLGMTKFYGDAEGNNPDGKVSIVTKNANKIIKDLGGKGKVVGAVFAPTMVSGNAVGPTADRGKEYRDKNFTAQPTFEITPEMAEKASGGMPLFQGAELYSQLARAIEAAPDKVFGKGENVAKWITANQGKLGIKKDEIFWSGITDWLDTQGKVTKADVLAFLDQKGVQVEEVVLGNRTPEALEHRRKHDELVAMRNAGEITPSESRDRLMALHEEYGYKDGMPGDTKHGGGNLVLPGGENYREMIITAPQAAEWGKSDTTHFGDTGEGKAIAWGRYDTRADAEGRTGTLIEEVQSKRGQAGRKEGFKNTKQAEQDKRAIADEIRSKYGIEVKQGGSIFDGDDSGTGTTYASLIKDGVDKDLARKFYDAYSVNKNEAGVPPAPFVSDSNNKATNAYITLMMKKQIIAAVEAGHEFVSWTTGAQQADRYDLSKQVDAVEVNQGNDFLFNVSVKRKGDSSYTAVAHSLPAEKLEEHVGKELAKKIVDEAGVHPLGLKNFSRKYTGLDLKVGGEWAHAMYGDENGLDKNGKPSLMTQAVRDIFKQLKVEGKVESVSISQGKETYALYNKETGNSIGGGYSLVQAQKMVELDPTREYKLEIGGTSSQPSFRITGALRAKVLEGMPLFQKNLASFDPNTMTMSMLKGANLSSVIHESGHFYLEALNIMASAADAPQQVKDDWEKTMKWFGTTTAEWSKMTLDRKRPHHEQWAQSQERWMIEGKAPTLEMQPVFARFRAFMLSVYKSLEAFLKANPSAGKLNDEVRGVFSRLIASEEAIAYAEQIRGYAALFPTAEAAGMTDKAFTEYMAQGELATQQGVTDMQNRSVKDMKWLSNAKNKALRSMQLQAASLRRKVKEEVTREVMAEPINQARTFLKSGETTDPATGDQVKMVKGFKLSTPDIQEMYPETSLSRPDLAKLKGLTTSDGGLHPDLVAQMFGLSSGDALVRDLIDGENAKDKIEGVTDQRMLEEHGDLVDARAVEQAANEAVHNEARARFLATGLQILAKSPMSARDMNKAAKVAAENVISRKKIRDIRPAQYASAEARSNKQALKDAAKDPSKAVEAQRAALLNNRLGKSAAEALSEVDKYIRLATKFQSEGTRKNLDLEYLEQIDDLLAPFDLRKGQTLRAIDKRRSLADWYDRQVEIGFEPVVDVVSLEEAKRKHYKDMTLEELRALVDGIQMIEHLGRLKKNLLTAKDAREFAERIAEANVSIAANANRTVEEKATASDLVGKAAAGARTFAAEHRKLGSMIREMDGGQDDGVMWNLIQRPANEAAVNKTRMRAEAGDAMAKLFAPIMKKAEGVLGNLYARRVVVPGTKLSMTFEQRIMFAMNWGNEGNRQRLLDGGLTGKKPVTEADALKILDTLDKADWGFVQSVLDYVGSYRSQVAAQERRLTGKEPKWIDAAEIDTKFGKYRGGYFPAKYDVRLSTRSESLEAATTLRMGMKGAFGAAATRSGYTKERAAEVRNRPMLLSFNAISQHVGEVTHRLAWQDWLIDANRVVRALDGTIREHYGVEILNELNKVREDIAEGTSGSTTATESAINHVRVGSTVVGLGWRVTTALLQPAGLSQSWSRIGGEWIAMGLTEYMKNPVEATRRVQEMDVGMRNRSATMQREINEVLNVVRAGEKINAVKASAFYLIGKMQQTVDVPTYLGAYQKALAALRIENAVDTADRERIEGHARALAYQAVVDSQGDGQIHNLARIQRGSPAMKLFTNFYSYFNSTYNRNIEAYRNTDFKSPTEVGVFAAHMLLLNTVPVILGVALKMLLKGECKWDDLECIAKRLGREQLSYLFGQMVLLRELGGAVDAATGGDTFGYKGPAGLRFFADVYSLGQQAGQGEADLPYLKAALSVTGTLAHLPTGQVNATLEGIIAIEKGEVKGAAILPALLAGPPKK